MALDAKKVKKAKELGLVFEPDITEEKLDTLIKEAEHKIQFQKDQDQIAKDNAKKAADEAKKNKVILKNVFGEDVDQAYYFFPGELRISEDKKGPYTTQTAPSYFNRTFGMPITVEDRPDLIEVFHQVFKPEKGFLFYKARDRELYLIIVPLKYAKTISRQNDSQPGDFQKHAISFITEGSVNLDSLRMKLTRIANHNTIAEN